MCQSMPETDINNRNDPPLADDQRIRVFIGADEHQRLAARTLEYTINETSSRPVRIENLDNYQKLTPSTLQRRGRTGFTFARFLIPALCGYQGRAIYLDADMLVFKDIAALWDQPMAHGTHLLYTRQPTERARKAQYAVLVLDCSGLDWRIDDIAGLMDSGAMTYDRLVYDFGLLGHEEKSDTLPAAWNSLERFVPGETALIHYTDMTTQPWVYQSNRNGGLWYDALCRALDAGFITLKEVSDEINHGNVSHRLPGLIRRAVPGTRAFSFGWTPPYLRRVRDSCHGVRSRLGYHLRHWTVWNPWLRHRIPMLRRQQLQYDQTPYDERTPNAKG